MSFRSADIGTRTSGGARVRRSRTTRSLPSQTSATSTPSQKWSKCSGTLCHVAVPPSRARCAVPSSELEPHRQAGGGLKVTLDRDAARLDPRAALIVKINQYQVGMGEVITNAQQRLAG
jgi:hypothetical protein